MIAQCCVHSFDTISDFFYCCIAKIIFQNLKGKLLGFRSSQIMRSCLYLNVIAHPWNTSLVWFFLAMCR
jgi:hypothetical protein